MRASGYLQAAGMAVIVFCLMVCALAMGVPAGALAAGPGWQIDEVHTYPTDLPPGGTGFLELHVYNTGAEASNGVITVTDVLPPSLTATAAYSTEATRDTGEGLYGEGFAGNSPEPEGEARWHCIGTRVVTCTSVLAMMPNVVQGELEKLLIAVKVAPVPAGTQETNEVTVAGGGASSSASASSQIDLGSTPSGLGFAHLDGWLTNANGTPDTQAGSHPYEFGLSFDLDNPSTTVRRVRNIAVGLPSGIIGDPKAVPQCPLVQFNHLECPAYTQVGVDTYYLGGEASAPAVIFTEPVYNLVPPAGTPAQFGFSFQGIEVYLDASVRSGGDYGITVHVDNLPETFDITGNTIVMWGVPAEASHNPERCSGGGGLHLICGLPGSPEVKPLLTLPTTCGAPPKFTIEGSSWEEPSITAKGNSRCTTAMGNRQASRAVNTLCISNPG